MKKLILVVVLVLMCGVSFADTPEKFTKVYKNPKGDVTFNHELHSVVVGKCDSCHSLFPNGVNKEVAHKECKSCHKENNAPTKCSDCHVK